MDPVFRLYSLFNRFLSHELALDEFEREFVPLLPYFAEKRPLEPAARLALAVDEALVDIGVGQATEDDLFVLLASSQASAPTVGLTIGGPHVETGPAETRTARMSFTVIVLTSAKSVEATSVTPFAQIPLAAASA